MDPSEIKPSKLKILSNEIYPEKSNGPDDTYICCKQVMKRISGASYKNIQKHHTFWRYAMTGK